MLPRRSPSARARVRASVISLFLACTVGLTAAASPAHAGFGELSRFGSLGPAAGQVPYVPRGIAADEVTGRVYVIGMEVPADPPAATRKTEVTVFERDGAFVGRIQFSISSDRVASQIAVDGPRQKLYVLEPAASADAPLDTIVQAFSTTNFAAAPTSFLAAGGPSTLSATMIAVDQSTDATFGGRVFLGFSTIVDPLGGGYINEYSKAGAFVRTIGGRVDNDGLATPVGKFMDGQLTGIGVASASHELVATGSGLDATLTHQLRVQRYAPATGAVIPSSVYAGSADPATIPDLFTTPFTVGPSGTVYVGATIPDGAETRLPLQALSPANAVLFSVGDQQATPPPVATCRWLPIASVAAGSGGDVYVASFDNDATVAQITRFGTAGTGCGLDPKIDTATADIPSPLIGQTVTLNATGTSPTPGAVSYQWDLDGNPATGTDGFESVGPTATRTTSFATAGLRTLRVRIVDAGGAPSPARSLDVTAKARPPVAKLAVSATSVTPGQAITLDASGSTSDVPITKYEWDLGGGLFDTPGGASPTLTKAFSEAGSYSVRVRVTAAGQTAISPVQVVSVKRVVTPPTTTNPAPTTPTKILTTVAKATVGSTLKGSVKKGLSVSVACAAGGAECRGTITLVSARKGKAVTYARVAYVVAPGKSATIVVKLKRAGKKALKRAKSAKANLLVAPLGGSSTTQAVKLKLSRR